MTTINRSEAARKAWETRKENLAEQKRRHRQAALKAWRTRRMGM